MPVLDWYGPDHCQTCAGCEGHLSAFSLAVDCKQELVVQSQIKKNKQADRWIDRQTDNLIGESEWKLEK